MDASPPTLVHADGLVVGDGPPIRDGAVLVDEAGAVLDVGDAETLRPRHAGVRVERVHGVVLPGLVNAHTHIELSAMRGRVPGGRGFVAWVDAFVGHRAEMDADDERTAIEHGVSDLDAFATTAVGDVSNGLLAVHTLARAGIGGAVFHEVFGSREEPLRRSVVGLEGMRQEVVGAWPTDDLRYAIAPHTLYTTHPAVVRELARAACDAGGLTSLHLAEHAPERSALERGEGAMVDWLRARTRGASDEFPWPRVGPVEHASALGAIGPHVLSVHVTDVTAAEAAQLARAAASVVLCPRSNLYIELRLPPVELLRREGVLLSLGTDSLASNASLDVLAEARALHDRFPEIPARALLQMATWNGAQALRRPDLGRIARGARPGLVAIDGAVGRDDVCAFVIAQVKAPRRWVVRRRATGQVTARTAA